MTDAAITDAVMADYLPLGGLEMIITGVVIEGANKLEPAGGLKAITTTRVYSGCKSGVDRV